MNKTKEFLEILLIFLEFKEENELMEELEENNYIETEELQQPKRITIAEIIEKNSIKAENLLDFMIFYKETVFSSIMSFSTVINLEDEELELEIVDNLNIKGENEKNIELNKIIELKILDYIKKSEDNTKRKIQEKKELKSLGQLKNIKYDRLKRGYKNKLKRVIEKEIKNYYRITKEKYNYRISKEVILNNFSLFKEIEVIVDINQSNKELRDKFRETIFNLNYREELELYFSLLQEEASYINELPKFLENLETLKEKINILKDFQVVKKKELNILENIKIIKKIKNFKDKEILVDIENKLNKKIVSKVLLKSVTYDVESYNWRVDYLFKGKINSLNIVNIGEIKKSKDIGTIKSKENKKIKLKKVKFRVFHEKNAKEKAIRFAVKHNMKIENNNNHSDITVEVEDINLVFRFAKNTVPSVIILEPLELKNRFLKELEHWEELYK